LLGLQQLAGDVLQRIVALAGSKPISALRTAALQRPRSRCEAASPTKSETLPATSTTAMSVSQALKHRPG
jgi:hypothetical protein